MCLKVPEISLAMEDEIKLPCLVFTLDEKGLDLFSFVWRVNNAWNLLTYHSAQWQRDPYKSSH